MTDMQINEQSEFNDFGYLKRLNLWWLETGIARQNADSTMWLSSLNNLFHELSTHIPKQEIIEEWIKKIREINQKVMREQKRNYLRNKNGISQDLYAELSTYELFLRKIYKEAGLETKTNKDPRFSLG